MQHCPSCQTVVSQARIQSGVAQCPRCETVFEVPESSADQSAPPIRKLELPIPPTHIVVGRHAHGVEIRIPWKYTVSGWMHLIVFGMLFFTMLAFVAGEGWLFSLLLFVLIGYGWLNLVLNSTTVLVARSGIEVSHGPLPTWHRTVRKSAANLRGLRVERERKYARSRYGGSRQYFVYHLDANSGRLMKHWPDDLAPEYVKECIEAVVAER